MGTGNPNLQYSTLALGNLNHHPNPPYSHSSASILAERYHSLVVFPAGKAARVHAQVMQRHTLTAFNTTFVVDSEYEFVKELGQGTYGSVIAVKHKRTGEKRAIKKIPSINTKVGVVSAR